MTYNNVECCNWRSTLQKVACRAGLLLMLVCKLIAKQGAHTVGIVGGDENVTAAVHKCACNIAVTLLRMVAETQ